MDMNTPKLAEALCKAQAVMTGAKKDKKNPFFKSNYADLSSVFDAIRDPFAENGLSITQTMDVLESGKSVICTRLMHVSGECIDSKMGLPEIADCQKLGSAITYLRRYMLMAIVGLAGVDDDGNEASRATKPAPKPPAATIKPEHIEMLEELINGHADIRALVLENCHNNFANITVDQLPGAVKWIRTLITKKESDNV